MTLSTSGVQPNLLTEDEAVTLRRVAFGESEVKVMRAADLSRLRRLGLIEHSKDGPRLTPAGRAVYDSLPKAVGRDRQRRGEDSSDHMESRQRNTRPR